MQKCQDLRNLDTCDNFRSFAVIDRGCDDVEPAALDPYNMFFYYTHPRTSHNRLSTELVHAARARARRATPTTRRSETFTPVGLRCTNSKSLLQAPVHRTSSSKSQSTSLQCSRCRLTCPLRAGAYKVVSFPFFMEDNYLFVSESKISTSIFGYTFKLELYSKEVRERGAEKEGRGGDAHRITYK
ncbi:hypothetical protein EVAR_86345_1 [Eumeta japonica]|uniref:Uncharacterized protein n=1 Tax=Eumeta variegata TaxID=151549 RepID=A0A4C1X4V7_EUMVA|nr:hypothetical protein EVAR_86345_1 [Eumeta japonica]